MIKNLEKSTVIKLKDQVPYLAGQVVSKTLAQNDSLSLTVFSFDKGEEISTHQSGGDAMVTVLEGTGRFTIDGEPHLVKEGETIVMPAKRRRDSSLFLIQAMFAAMAPRCHHAHIALTFSTATARLFRVYQERRRNFQPVPVMKHRHHVRPTAENR